MNPLNSKVELCEVSKLREQYEALCRVLESKWTKQPTQHHSAPLKVGRLGANTFSGLLGSDATAENAIDLLELNQIDAAAFLHVASDLLESVKGEAKTLFATEPHREKTEFGLLCGFVSYRLDDMQRKNREGFSEPFFLK